MVAPNLLVYQIKMFDGSFRFIVSDDKKLVQDNLSQGEKIIGVETLEQLLGGYVDILIREKV